MYQYNPLLTEAAPFLTQLKRMRVVPTTAASTGIGAVVGAAKGFRKDENGNRHLLKNVAVGAGAGLAMGASVSGGRRIYRNMKAKSIKKDMNLFNDEIKDASRSIQRFRGVRKSEFV